YVVLTVCGGRILINFNPFMRLDGYYLLSDWADIPNLRRRSWDLVLGHLRRFLWGGPRPEPEPRARFLLVYGALSWFMSVGYLALMLVALAGSLGTSWGLAGVAAAVGLGVLLLPRLFRGFAGGEVVRMILTRRKRTAVWVGLLAGV